jgi:oxygen-independent coproporphyrinogen-3 oxidase
MKGWHLDSLYIGGGTPTSVSAEQLRELLEELDRNFDLESLAEFTVEAGRPDTITEDKLRVMKEFPVTRISINPQTMNQKTLDIIGRHHSVEQTEEVFAMARRLGFDNINMDMIVGLPGEGAAEVQETLDRIRRLDPDSLTVHSLALKRATRLNLFRDNYEPISFENSEAIMQAAAKCAEDMGMSPYYLYRQKNMAGNFENVGYARPGKAGVYNILIMEERQSILAAGSGASTKFVFDGGRRIERAENVKDLHNYVERIDEMLERKKFGIDSYLKN